MAMHLRLLAASLLVTACSALQPALWSAVSDKRAEQFPDLGSIAKGVLGAAVDAALPGTIQAAATTVNQSLAAVGDQFRALQDSVHNNIVDTQTKIKAAQGNGTSAALVFKQQATAVLQNASSQLGAAMAAIDPVVKAASGILVTLSGNDSTIQTFANQTNTISGQASAWKQVMDSTVQQLQALNSSSNLTNNLQGLCPTFAGITSQANSMASMATNVQVAFDGFAQNSIAALTKMLPASSASQLQPVLLGVSAQASTQLSPVAGTATDLADGITSSIQMVGLCQDLPLSSASANSSNASNTIMVVVALGVATLIAASLIYFFYFCK